MTKQKKPIPIPLALRITQLVFPTLEKVSLRLAVNYFYGIFFTPLRYKTPEKEIEAVATAEKFTVISNGRKVQCYQWGDASKPYVLVVHGWAGRATQFRRFIPIFNAGGYRIIGFDGPAHGKSEGSQTSIPDFAEAMNKLAGEKGNPLAIVAHSFGGVASLYAIVNGLPVKKLINIASPTIGDRIIKTYLKAVGGSKRVVEGFKQRVNKNFGKPFEEFTSMELVKKAPPGFNLIVIHDEEDREVELVHVEELLKVYPSARLQLTSGLGHNRILKDDLVIQSCLTFVKENPK